MAQTETPTSGELITEQTEIRLVKGIHIGSDKIWHVKGRHTNSSLESAGHIAHVIYSTDGLKEVPVGNALGPLYFCRPCLRYIRTLYQEGIEEDD